MVAASLVSGCLQQSRMVTVWLCSGVRLALDRCNPSEFILMPNVLRKQTKLRPDLRRGDRVTCQHMNRDVARIEKVNVPTGEHLLDFWNNGHHRAADATTYRLVYVRTSDFIDVDGHNKIKYMEIDIFPRNGAAKIGEMRVRIWYVHGRRDSVDVSQVNLGGNVIYQLPGL